MKPTPEEETQHALPKLHRVMGEFMLMNSDTKEIYPATFNTLDELCRRSNAFPALVAALQKALLVIEKAKPYVRDHACMTADDMRGLGGDPGDAYWLDVAESFTAKAQAQLDALKAAGSPSK